MIEKYKLTSNVIVKDYFGKEKIILKGKYILCREEDVI